MFGGHAPHIYLHNICNHILQPPPCIIYIAQLGGSIVSLNPTIFPTS